MNSLQVVFAAFCLTLLLITGQCSPVQGDRDGIPSVYSQVPRFRRFDLSFLNEKRSDFDDPRFFSSAYGKRSGGHNFRFNPEFTDFQL
ncbi:hypothetical protein FO519_001731 [Halicephalobus sp. NKZ332]|nr:hypothetical protein FO519_001731 [Halicephalobus sp. NKZ332]